MHVLILEMKRHGFQYIRAKLFPGFSLREDAVAQRAK
jgi:hypothetical protein